MAEAAVSFLLENLKQVLKYKIELIEGVEEEVQDLLRDLGTLKSSLKDAAEQRINNNAHTDLVLRLKDVIDKAEDAIENFIIQKAQHQAQGMFRRFFRAPIHANDRGNIAEEIRTIRTQVDAIYTRNELDLRREAPAEPVRGASKPVLEEFDDVERFDEEGKIIVERLKISPEGPEDLEVTTIVGMAGLGKTTLANKIYNHPDIDYEFFTRAWVQVSEHYNVKDTLLSLYFEISKEQPSDKLRHMQPAELAEEIREILSQVKYFIVLDDVWTTRALDDMMAAFPNTKKGSRILITSRYQVVGRHANPNIKPHNLRFLTEEESLELLRKKVSRDVNNRIILGDRNNGEGCRVSVGWSYENLPYYLKPCFLYFGMFPEDYEIPVWKLIQLWIAEGFIEQQGESSLEETAEELLNALVNRNLVMVAKWRSDGRIKTCQVHDMVFEFCKAKAREENFYLNVRGSMVGSLENCRRICIHSDVQAIISRGNQLCGNHVRSFLSCEPGMIPLDGSQVSIIPKAFKLLKVLDLRPLIFTLFPKKLCKLLLLRYIAISTNFKLLPSGMSKLWNIQTIIIETTEPELEIKKELWELQQLRHLISNASIVLQPPATGGGGETKSWDNIQTLYSISPECCTEEILSKVPNTKKLGVRGRLATLLEAEGKYPLFNNIGKLDSLKNLKLFNDEISDNAGLPQLPKDHMFPYQLTKLTLSATMLEWDAMKILEKLEKLEKLKLKDRAFKGELWEAKEGGFPSLQVLNIRRTDLKYWKVETKYSFPILKRLVLQQCEDLEEVPMVFAELSSFQELEIIRTSRKAAYSAKKIQELKKSKDGQGGLKLSISPPDLIF